MICLDVLLLLASQPSLCLIELDMHAHLYLCYDGMTHRFLMQFSKAGIGVSHYQAMQRALH